MKPKIAIVRGKFLNRYEMQFFEPLVEKFDITAFGSLTSFHSTYRFPVISLPSPMDLPDIPCKMPIINRLFIDAHYLHGLENKLEGFDLVHSAETYYRYTNQSLQAKRRGKVKKVIATVLENIPFNNESIWGRKSYKKQSREELDHIIALTELTKQTLLTEGADKNKISVISHYVDTKRFNIKASEAQKENKIKKTNKKITILFCGRLEEYKGVFDILAAAEILLQDKNIDTPLHFIFVGNGSQKNKMIDIERKKGIEYAIEHTEVSYDEMPKIYALADIYVAPSKPSTTWVEQYNTTLLEAQASGLPIVTTKSGGIPENVADAAVLVEPGDIQALVLALKVFVLSPEKRELFGKKARTRAVQTHDISIGASKIEALWNQVLRS